MIVKEQKKILFNNVCNCIVDYDLLESAILWYQKEPTSSNKKIYMHGNYPAVSIHDKKIHIHRLIMLYITENNIPKDFCVHHVNKNKKDARLFNLQLINVSKHQNEHHKGKKLSEKHRKIISENNTKNKLGKRFPYRREDVSSKDVYELYTNGYSFNKISILKNIDWSVVKQRYIDYINNNPELLKN